MAITAPDSAPFRYPKPLRRGAACLNCRKSKQACDAVQPECGPCLLRHRQCEYAPLVGPVKKRQQKVVELESQLKDEGGSSTRISPTPSNTSKGSFKVASSPAPPSSRGTSTNGMSDDASSPTASRSTDGTSPASSYDISSPSSQLHSISPTSSTPRGLDTALAEQEPPGLDTDYPRKMLATILPYRDHFGLDIDVSHWLETINLPLSHPGSFHPCLLNAICVAGTSISGSGETQRVWEKHFYQAARRQMQESLSLCDRMDDWFYTSLLLLGYGLLRTSPTCILEICQSSLPMAVACNLHRQGKPADYAQQDYGLLQPARNASHANDRINMWWTLWTMDKRIANSMDIQEAFPYRDPEVVTTPLPLPRSTIELYGYQFAPWRTLQDLFLPGHADMDVSNDSALGLRVKSHIAFSEAVKTANIQLGRSPQPSWTPTPPGTINAMITRFLETVRSNETAYSVASDVPLRPLLARMTLYCLCAAVILFGLESNMDEVVYRKRLSAARWMASIYKELQAGKMHAYRYICIAPFWACGRPVIQEEIVRASQSSVPLVADEPNDLYAAKLEDELSWMNSHVDSEKELLFGAVSEAWDLSF